MLCMVIDTINSFTQCFTLKMLRYRLFSSDNDKKNENIMKEILREFREFKKEDYLVYKNPGGQ